MTPLTFLLIALVFSAASGHEQPCEVGVFDVHLSIDNLHNYQASFSAKQLKLPSGDALRGWVLQIPEADDLVKSIFVASGEDYYLAYRSLTTSFEGNNIVGDGKSINVIYSSDFRNGSAETHSIRVQFHYDPDWDVITEQEFNQLLQWLNDNRVKRVNYVSELKQFLSAAAANYVANATNSHLAGKSRLEIQAKIQELRNRIEALQNDSADAENELNKTQDSIRGNENQLQILKKDLTDQSGKLVQLSGQLSSQKNMLVSLQSAKATNTYSRETFSATAAQALQSIQGLINNYKPECTVDGWWLDKAYADLQKDKVLGNFEASVRKALLP